LITGESGTGKELVAGEIHYRSKRCCGPYVTVDCTTLTDTLFESLLFGHCKGAFTGAHRANCGFFRAAHTGTLFLDEVGELPLALQDKLLRSIEERRVVPLGMHTGVSVNVRLIAATHRDLRSMVAQGRFREDLFYRLHVLTIHLPPLRERGTETIRLAQAMLAKLGRDEHEPAKSLAADAVAALKTHSWPGNIRELANAIEHAFAMTDGPIIHASDLPETVTAAAAPAGAPRTDCTLADAERSAVIDALRLTSWQKTNAARLLGIRRQSLYRLIKRHGLATPV
jgi:DNA-binding NtrC family response regulator